jgi:hypothetical protein
MVGENWVKASPKELAEFFMKCNHDKKFRDRFLENPIKMLNDHKIQTSPDAEKEIIEQVTKLKNIPMIHVIPANWSEEHVEFLTNGYGLKVNVAEQSDDEVVIP